MTLAPVPTFDQLVADPALARELPAEAALKMLLALAPITEALRLQALRGPASGNGQPEVSRQDRFAQPAAPPELPGPDFQAGRKPMPDVARTSLLSVREAAKMLSCSEAALRKWVYGGMGDPLRLRLGVHPPGEGGAAEVRDGGGLPRAPKEGAW